MAQFNQIAMTNDGLALHAKAQTGVQLEFARMAVGDGELLPEQLLQDLTGLINEKQSLPINSININEHGDVRIRGVINNSGLAQGYYVREIGLFANDPDKGEILYCVANAGELADYIPPGGGSEVVESTLDIITVVGNAENVTAVIDESLTFVTVQRYESEQGTVELTTTATQIRTAINELDAWKKNVDPEGDGKVNSAIQADSASDSDKLGSQLPSYYAKNADLVGHVTDQLNPHNVTADQVGSPTTIEFNEHVTNQSNPHSVTATQVGAPTVADLNSHQNDENNPHNVTKTQLGLENVQNYSFSSIFDMLHPIGDVVIRYDNQNPGNLPFWNGTWQRIAENRMLIGQGSDPDFNVVGNTGGEKTHTLIAEEIPSHTHGLAKEDDYRANGTSSGVLPLIGGGSDTSTNSAGGGQPHNNMPPYEVVYIWRRTA